jgi:hypothetical protein
MSTFTYTIKYPDGRVEHHTGAVRKEPSASLQTDIEQGDAKIVTNAARALRRESQLGMAATWLSRSAQSEASACP